MSLATNVRRLEDAIANHEGNRRRVFMWLDADGLVEPDDNGRRMTPAEVQAAMPDADVYLVSWES